MKPLVCFGDSITEGWRVEPEEAFPALLETILDVPVMNAGWRGDRAVDALDRLESQVLEAEPRAVVVFFGGNEADQGDPVEDAVSGQERILKALAARRIPSLVVAHPYEPYGGAFQDALATMARRLGADVMRDALVGIYGNEDLLVDASHPNPRGHQVLAERLAPAVRRLLART